MRVCSILYVIVGLIFFQSCKNEDPAPENIPELITKATLTFTPSGGSPVTVTATDPDGDGVQDITVDGPIHLAINTTYSLTIDLINGLHSAGEEGYSISDEVKEEGDEHIFYFSWSDGVFSNPAGNGNIDNRTDPVNYTDKDENDLPLGLETSWTTGSGSNSKEFRVLLKHQPGLKSSTSTSSDGESDFDITFTIHVN